jgi:hypothetical protein
VNLPAIRLLLTGVWFGLAAYCFWAGPQNGPFGPSAGWLAMALGVYNLFRWQAARTLTLPPPPTHRRRRDHDRPPTEYHPEFDFTKDGTAECHSKRTANN